MHQHHWIRCVATRILLQYLNTLNIIQFNQSNYITQSLFVSYNILYNTVRHTCQQLTSINLTDTHCNDIIHNLYIFTQVIYKSDIFNDVDQCKSILYTNNHNQPTDDNTTDQSLNRGNLGLHWIVVRLSFIARIGTLSHHVDVQRRLSIYQYYQQLIDLLDTHELQYHTYSIIYCCIKQLSQPSTTTNSQTHHKSIQSVMSNAQLCLTQLDTKLGQLEYMKLYRAVQQQVCYVIPVYYIMLIHLNLAHIHRQNCFMLS